jgi:hypothetical protein
MNELIESELEINAADIDTEKETEEEDSLSCDDISLWDSEEERV